MLSATEKSACVSEALARRAYENQPVEILRFSETATGPLFGRLGERWRAHVAWLGALATTAPLCLDPLARITAGRAIRFRDVWMAEVAFGVALAIFFVADAIAIRDRGRRDPTPA